MSFRHSVRRAHTLVELLIVIAIIGLLIALLLPAVQAARESARSTQCRNHLRQLGVALHSYQDVHGAFPPAFVGEPAGWRPSWSWTTFLLPHLEQSGLYDELQVPTAVFGDGAIFADTPTPTTQIPLGVYMCPSDAGHDLNHRKSNHAKSSYRAVMGNRTLVITSYPILTVQNGVFYTNSHVALEQISDGSTQTVLVGECRLDPDESGKRGALWAGMRGELGIILYISDAMWWLNGESDWRINGSGEQAFSSRHPGGAHFVFGDASVRLLADTINGLTLQRLAARADGEALAAF